jgi:hypothetical protein
LGEGEETICLVHWSEATLEVIRSIHRKQRRDGVDFRVVWLQANELEPLCVGQPKEKISRE